MEVAVANLILKRLVAWLPLTLVLGHTDLDRHAIEKSQNF